MARSRRAPARQHSSGNTPLWAIILVIACTFFLSAGQILLKLSTEHATFPLVFLHPTFLIGGVLLVAAGLLITFALKHGELSVLYPFIALGFIWVTVAGIILFGEQPSAHQLFGTALIIAGVSLIGHQRARKVKQ